MKLFASYQHLINRKTGSTAIESKTMREKDNENSRNDQRIIAGARPAEGI